MAQKPPERFLTPQEVADRLSVKVRTIYKVIDAGDLEAVRVGGRLRVSPDALGEYLRRSSTR